MTLRTKHNRRGRAVRKDTRVNALRRDNKKEFTYARSALDGYNTRAGTSSRKNGI